MIDMGFGRQTSIFMLLALQEDTRASLPTDENESDLSFRPDRAIDR